MTDKRMLGFTDEGFARDDGGAVVFWGQEGGNRIRCRISREALDDHLSDRGKLKPDAAFRKYRKQIEGSHGGSTCPASASRTDRC